MGVVQESNRGCMVCTKIALQGGGVLRAENAGRAETMLVKFEQCILSGNKANVRPWSEAQILLLCREGL